MSEISAATGRECCEDPTIVGGRRLIEFVSGGGVSGGVRKRGVRNEGVVGGCQYPLGGYASTFVLDFH